jgi:hypothetical protein
MIQFNAVPNTPKVSISTSAVLIDLHIGAWTGRKQDKRAASEVTTNNNAKAGIANVTKKLLGDCDSLTAVQKFIANTRNTHASMTMPWSDLGLRLCPLPIYLGSPGRDGYEKVMSGLEQEYWRLVNTFLDEYEWEMANAQLLSDKLGSLFNPDEYPTRAKLSDKFSFRCTAIPVPSAGDWRLDINNEATAVLTETYDKYYKQQIDNAMRDIWMRVHKAVTSMCDGLDRYGLKTEKGNKQTFRDTLVENVVELIDLMGACNITNDAAMTEAQRRLSIALDGVTPEALREDEHLRAETRKQVNEVKKIIANLPGLGF